MKVSEGILRGVQERTGLDVGEFPDDDRTAGAESDDPQRLVKIVAHMVARGMDKFTPLRKLSRQSEGGDKRSGFFSDALAAGVELYKRNPEQMEALARDYYKSIRAKRKQKETAKKGTA